MSRPITFTERNGETCCDVCLAVLPPPTGRVTWPPKAAHMDHHATNLTLGRDLRRAELETL